MKGDYIVNMNPVRKPSSKDVAELAGVSRATVSRAFNATYKMDKATRQKVIDAADALQYRPNAIARSLNQQRTNIVGILVRNTSDIFYATALDYMIYALQEAGFQSLVFLPKDSADIDTVMENALQYQVDAMIVFSVVRDSKLVQTFVFRGVPTILFNRYIDDSGASSVCLNDMSMGRKIAQELHNAGHRNFCFLSADESASTIINRKIGFVMQLQALGIASCQIIQAGFRYEDGMQAAKQMLQENPTVDACFACCDAVALGALDYLRLEAGKSVPEDIAVVGFDDSPMSSNVHYQLSTVRQPWKQLVQATVDTVIERINDKAAPPISKVLEGIYVSRGTTRKLK